MENTKNQHHQINYIEFSVTDMQEAQSFYSSAFGWKFNQYGPGYAGIQSANGEAGGFSLVDKVVLGGPLVILYSKNLDQSLSQVTKAGGKISTPPFEFPGGRRFHFKDPSGNELAVWSEK